MPLMSLVSIIDSPAFFSSFSVAVYDDCWMNAFVDEFFSLAEKFTCYDYGACCAVADFVVLCLRYFNHHLGGWVLNVHFAQNGSPVAGYCDVAEAVDEHLVHAFGSQGALYRFSEYF